MGKVEWCRVALYLLFSTVFLGNLSAYLRNGLQWNDGYSRKLNHVGLMLIAGPLLAFLPEKKLIPSIAAGATGLTVIYAVSAWSKFPAGVCEPPGA